MIITSNSNIDNNDYNSVLYWYSSTQNNVLMRDRFGSLNKFSKWKFSFCYDTIPSSNVMNGTSEEFRNIFYENISYIYKKYENIYISWSGGVDSTAILCGLINYGFDKKNIHILCTPDSIEEYPLLYERLKKNNYDIRFITHEYMINLSKSLNDNEILLLGTPADQLFGHKFSYLYNDYNNKKWETFIIDHTNNYKSFIYQLRYMIEDYNLKDVIKNSQSLFWWLNFSLKWEYVHLFYPCAKQIHYIYDDYKFQEWCMSRLDIIADRSYTNPLYYKKEIKDIILDVTKDYDYVRNKTKECSYKKVMKYGRKFKMFLIQFDSHIQEYNTYEAFYNELMRHQYE